MQNLDITNNPPSCDAYGQPLQPQPPQPQPPQPQSNPANASPDSRPGSAYQPRRDSEHDEVVNTTKVEDPHVTSQHNRKVEVYKYYERDAGAAVEEHFNKALNRTEQGKNQLFWQILTNLRVNLGFTLNIRAHAFK